MKKDCMSPFSIILIKEGSNKMEELKGNVFNIQRYTIHDGPGIRTEVFLKGCPLSCKWCSNPEGLYPHSELGVYPSKCIGKDVCGDCIKACPLGGKPIVFGEDNKLSSLRRDICLGCLSCTKVSFPKALKRWGDPMTVKEVMDVVYADRNYFESSGGGITLNGGEVMVQWKFALAILKECKKNGINTCVETTMFCDQEHLDTIILGHASMPDRTAAILSKDPQRIQETAQKLLSDAKTLETLGADCIAVTCNTAHYFVDQIADQISIPFIHMIRETAKAAAAACPGEKVGILATDGTIRTELYQKALAAENVIPCVLDAEGQSLVMHEIYDCVKPGKPVDEAAWQIIDEKLHAMGCKCALLACTELSVIKADKQLNDFYMDPMEVMADRCLAFFGKKEVSK